MNNSFDQNKNNFVESMLKGRMTESLVEELLKESGNVVYRFGFEAIIQNLTQIKKSFDSYSEAGERIRSIPDFIVIDTNGTSIFLEVKFRWNGKPHDDDRLRLERIQSFWNAKIIFVNCIEKPFFRISSSPYIDKRGGLVVKPLIEEIDWKINKTAYDKAESLVEKYLASSFISDK